MKMPSNLMRLRVLAFSLVIVIVPFIVYYYFWVSRQTKYFTGRDLRVLAALSTHVKESVESQSTVFQNAADKYLDDLRNPQSKSEGDTKDKNQQSPITLELLRKKGHKDFQKEALDPLKGDGTNLEATSLIVVPEPTDKSSLSVPKVEIRLEQGTQWLYFDYTTSLSVAQASSSASVGQSSSSSRGNAGAKLAYLNFRAKINFAELIGPFVNKREIEENRASTTQDGFDAVLIAELDDDLNVVFQESAAQLRILSLNNLFTTSGAKVDVKLLGQSTSTSDVKVGPSDYKLFIQPVQISLPKAGANNPQTLRWLACGLVESKHFLQQTLSVSYMVLIVFGFLTVLVAISWPFLKLVFIGPKDRFRPLDAYLLVISAFMISALLTLLAVFGYTYRETEKDLDRDLAAFADAIQSNFSHELDTVLSEADALNCNSEFVKAAGNFVSRETIETHLSERCTDFQKQEAKPVLDKFRPHKIEMSSRSSILSELLKESSYPYFNSAFWVDSTNLQRVKWTVRSSVTKQLNLNDRAYVYKLRQGSQYEYIDSNKLHEFWIDPVISKTTGANTVIISKRLFSNDPKLMWVSAIQTRLLSLMQPVIIKGFGFAVIDDTGTILFHSDEKQHLGENLFEECDHNRALLAAVLGRSPQNIHESYLGKGHSLYVKPLSHLPWTVVVFHEKDSLRTTFSETLTLCLLLFFFYLLMLSLLLMAIYVVNGRSQDRSTWLWPDPSKKILVIRSMTLNAMLLVLSCIAVQLPGSWKLIVPLLIGLAAVFLFVWRFKRAKVDESASTTGRLKSFDYHIAYVVNITLLFGLASILPAYACFKISHAEEIELFIKESQVALVESMMDRSSRIRTQSVSTYQNTEQADIDKFVLKRIDEERDIYDSFFFDTNRSIKETTSYPNVRESRLMRLFKHYVPLFNQSSIERQAMISKAADNSWGWEWRSPDLVFHASDTEKTREFLVSSRLPYIEKTVWWLAWPALFALVSLLLGYMIRKLFLFAHEEVTGDELSNFCFNSVSQNLLLVLSPPFVGKSQLLERLGLNRKELKRIDIEEAAELETWLQQCDLSNPNGHPVVLDNFDSGLEDISSSQKRLRLLEALQEKRRLTLALSNLDPESFLLTNRNADTNKPVDNGALAVLAERWTDAVSRFLKMAPMDVGNPDLFKAFLNERKNKLLEQECLDEPARSRIISAFELIERECSSRACLQNIGEAIANQPSIGAQKIATLLKQILGNATPYYKALWKGCSDDEKLTLSRLAQYGLLSPSDPDIEHLLRKGLIIKDPAIRVMNESFRLFILRMRNEPALAECEERAKKESSWQVLKVPLTIGLASVIAFLLLTQRELYNSALPFITALTAGVPSFLKLISLFQSDSGGKASA